MVWTFHCWFYQSSYSVTTGLLSLYLMCIYVCISLLIFGWEVHKSHSQLRKKTTLYGRGDGFYIKECEVLWKWWIYIYICILPLTILGTFEENLPLVGIRGLRDAFSLFSVQEFRFTKSRSQVHLSSFPFIEVRQKHPLESWGNLNKILNTSKLWVVEKDSSNMVVSGASCSSPWRGLDCGVRFLLCLEIGSIP